MNEAREKHTFDVFLSHNSKDKPAVRALAALLGERDLRVWLDEEQLTPGQPWQPLLEKGIRESTTGAVLVGADGLGPWEDEEMQAFLIFAVSEHKPVIPVLLPGAPEKVDLPVFLKNRTWVDLREGFGTERIDNLIWGITGEHPSRKPVPLRTSEPIISVTRLRHGADGLVGREKELARLDAAWHDPKTHVVTIVAWGGVGKTALVVEWMARMARDGWRGAERVFDWSFYSQGTSETTTASADAFVAKALEFFGDPDPKQGSPWDKGERLARLVAKRRALLVLDGVEPLQYPPGPVGGKLKDPALEALLKGLAQHNPGLCLVTTREPLTDLAPFQGTTSPQWDLEHLSPEAGARLLFDAGVDKAGSGHIKADDRELKDTAREVGGHALTLQLLGRYLARNCNGDVRKRKEIPFDKAEAQFKTNPADADKKSYGHAFKVMAAYEKWLRQTGEDGERQLAVLHLLGLFDRPADPGCIGALRREPPIEGLTEPLTVLDEDEWNYTLSNLRECGLIATHGDDLSLITNHSNHLSLDAHPLVREYFGRQLREQRPDAWQAGHRRLYEHLCATTTDRKDAPTLQDLQPLYQAVSHGCLAGMQRDAYEQVYVSRILRNSSFYSTYTLGAFGQELSAMASFHQQDIEEAIRVFPSPQAAKIMRQMGYCLRPIGRLTDSTGWIERSLKIHEELADWHEAAIDAGLLSTIHQDLGRLEKGVVYAEKAMRLAKRYGETIGIVDASALYGHGLWRSGRRKEARTAFDEYHKHPIPIEELEQNREWCYLTHLVLFRLADFSEDQNELSDIQTKAERLLVPMIKSKHNRGLAMANLTCAVCLSKLTTHHSPKVRSRRRDLLDQAIHLLHKSGRIDALPSALLLRSVEESPDSRRRDLDEAWQITERGSMRLLMADVHLYRARLFRDKAALVEARKLIDACGYHRRDQELTDAETASKDW